MSKSSYHNGFPLVSRDSAKESEYRRIKLSRQIESFQDIVSWPIGLQERFLRRISLVSRELRHLYGNAAKYKLVSSWVDGCGIDEGTEKEEPYFYSLKKDHKTWGGRHPESFKLSDFDINMFSADGIRPISISDSFIILDDDFEFKVDMYISKGERGIWL